MALLFCYKPKNKECTWKDKAIYLDQSLYKIIFDNYFDIEGNSILKGIASLGYDDELEIHSSQLEQLETELQKFAQTSNINSEQFFKFIDIVKKAIKKDVHLMVSGDMYPVLKPKKR